MIFFTSDSHFNDEKIIKRENRPFKDAKESDNYIIKLWNKQAKKGDTIYHLGDFISYGETYRKLYLKGILNIKKIKADVALVIGNNEERLIKGEFNNNFEDFKNHCLKLGFKDVKKEEFLDIEGNKFYLNHYPKSHKEGYINLYGHLHKLGGLFKPFGMNVSCDVNYLKLHSLIEILELLSIRDDIMIYDPELIE